ncbi:MAG TPA: hypothetical protein PK048_00075 [Candidatus Absconditabacterales bacterium]|nr:hypothetical protein [Candidatus Absconditabacterales bacterium]
MAQKHPHIGHIYSINGKKAKCIEFFIDGKKETAFVLQQDGRYINQKPLLYKTLDWNIITKLHDKKNKN